MSHTTVIYRDSPPKDQLQHFADALTSGLCRNLVQLVCFCPWNILPYTDIRKALFAETLRLKPTKTTKLKWHAVTQSYWLRLVPRCLRDSTPWVLETGQRNRSKSLAGVIY